jgi:hypothetical protein
VLPTAEVSPIKISKDNVLKNKIIIYFYYLCDPQRLHPVTDLTVDYIKKEIKYDKKKK